jgi:hypothetical protein
MVITKRPPLDRVTITALMRIVTADTVPTSLRDRAAIFLLREFSRQRDQRRRR